MTPALSGALMTFALDAIAVTALLVSPLGAELLSLIFDLPIHYRRQPMTADEPTHITVDFIQTVCPMCDAHIFDSVVPYTDGDVTVTPGLKAQALRTIEEHERVCPGNR